MWILIYTKANEEKRAENNLKQQGFETFLPLILAKNKNTNTTEAMVPLFPRYLFVNLHLSLENWNAINSTYGVRNIVMFSEKFTSVPDAIITMIKQQLDGSHVYKEDISFTEYQKGDPVSIKDGRFAGVDAIFLSKKSKDRVRLLLKLLNTSVVTEINQSDLGKKEIIKKFKL